jgi:hypothetical protein
MDAMLKVIEMIMGIASSKSQTLSKQVISTLRQIIFSIIVSLGAMALFCVGVSLALSDLSQQLKNQPSVSFEGALLIGTILSIVSLAVFLMSLSQKTWLKAASLKEEASKPTTSPIEEAIGLLIADFVMERQMKRKAEAEGPQV